MAIQLHYMPKLLWPLFLVCTAIAQTHWSFPGENTIICGSALHDTLIPWAMHPTFLFSLGFKKKRKTLVHFINNTAVLSHKPDVLTVYPSYKTQTFNRTACFTLLLDQLQNNNDQLHSTSEPDDGGLECEEIVSIWQCILPSVLGEILKCLKTRQLCA